MRVLVCGSRKTGNPNATREAIWWRLGALPTDTTIMHGGADGVDTWADAIAYGLELETDVRRADWDTYGKKAGILRNLEMLDSRPDLVIAFWDGSSRGTLHTITEAKNRGIPVEVIPIESVQV